MIQYKVLARFTPFNSKEEFVTIRSESFLEDIITFCLDSEDVVFDKSLQEGDIVTVENKTFIKKVENQS